MALINQNSIIGVTSITSPSASNVLTFHTNNTTERLRVSTSGVSFSGTNASLDTSGNATFNGNVSIGGTLTYEDVTNIDAVGVVTARAGVNISGGNLQVGGTNVINSGRVLYNLEQLKLADTKELVLGSGNDLKIYHSGSHSFISEEGAGALKIKGDDIRFEDAGGTEALRIDSAGKIGVGDATPENTLSIKNIGSFEGDANSFYLGSNFTGTGQNFSGSGKHAQRFFFNNASSNGYLKFENTGTTGNAGDAITWQERFRIRADGTIRIGGDYYTDTSIQMSLKSSATGCQIQMHGTGTGTASSDGLRVGYNGSGGQMWLFESGYIRFATSNVERLRIDSSGRVLISGQAALTSTSLSYPIQVAAASDANAIAIFGRAADDIGELAYYEADKTTKLGELQYRRDHLNLRHRVGDIRFATGGTTERLRIDSAGRMGLGADNPGDYDGEANDFVVRSANHTGITIASSGSNQRCNLYFSDGTSSTQKYRGAITYDHNDDSLMVRTAAVERLRISSNGSATFDKGAPGGANQVIARFQAESSRILDLVWHDSGSRMGFDTPGSHPYTFKIGGSEYLRLRSTHGSGNAFGPIVESVNGTGAFFNGGTSNKESDSTVAITKQSNNDWGLMVRNYEGTSTDYGFYSRSKNTASYAIGVFDHDNSAWRFRVSGGGSIYATNTTLSSISDQRLKENIVDANSQWDDIKALRFRNFNWREDSGLSDGRTYLGLIAQEVEPISPNLVDINAQTKEDIENEVPDPEYKNVKYSIVWMKAVKALQEAQTRIETLETQLTDALARITTLEGS